MAMDLVTVVKHLFAKASLYGIDPNKIVLNGVSGGGYAVSAACSKLAQMGQSNLVKLAILNQYVVPAYHFTDRKEDMPHKQARQAQYDCPYMAKALATNFDKQWAERDPVLFPTMASDEVLT